MKKSLIYLIVAAVIVIGIVVAFLTFTKKTNTTSVVFGGCSQYSNKDGYTGCMSLLNGKEKKCRFKVDSKVNETTQQRESTYTCTEK